MTASKSELALLAGGLSLGLLVLAVCIPVAQWTGNVPFWGMLLGSLAMAAIPACSNGLAARFDALRTLPPRKLRWMTLAVFAGSLAVLFLTAWAQSRSFVPTWHDHHMYALQAQMAAKGRLWMPEHPQADFFETFHVLTKGVYASMYFPGTALVYAPSVWVGAPYPLFPLLVAAGIVALLFSIVTELQDCVAGLLAALGMLAVSQFRFLSVDLMSHTVALLLSLAMVRAWLAWRVQGSYRWAAVLGACAGWAGITRPVDALSFAIPVGLAMVWELRRGPALRGLATMALVVVSALPFLAVQGVFNLQVTGSLATTPAEHYSRVTWGLEAMRVGEQIDQTKTMEQISKLPQKQLYYECFMRIPMSKHRNLAERVQQESASRLAVLVAQGAPGGWALVLLPLGCLALGDIRRMVLASQPLLFLAGYLIMIPEMIDHYYVLTAPAVIVLVGFGRERLEKCLNQLVSDGASKDARRAKGSKATLAPTSRGAISSGLALALAASAVCWFPGFREVRDENTDGYRLLKYVHTVLPEKIQAPAVVLFRFHPGLRNSFHSEPVYNVDAAWPDDAPIVKAHDLGAERDIEIAEYYARLQPERRFYLFDRNDDVNYRVKYLGTAGEFAAQLRALVKQQKQKPKQTEPPAAMSSRENPDARK